MKAGNHKFTLRGIRESDCEFISNAFKKQGWNKPPSQYRKYVEYQKRGTRDVIIAELASKFAGYLTIGWKSDYEYFSVKNIPEIIDFNVLEKYQRLGIGTKLMDEAEKRVKEVSEYCGIGFGVTKNYGAAQILYIKRGYIPDGNGLIKNSTSIAYGEAIIVNGDIAFYLLKRLLD